MEEDRNVVVMGDINARSERWGGDGVRSDLGGRIIEGWMDEWGFELGTLRGIVTRVGERRGEGDGVIDVGMGVGGIEMEGRVREEGVGMDNKVLEMVVKLLGWEIVKDKKEKWGVNWEVVKEGGKGVDWDGMEEGLRERGREGLKNRVEKVQEKLGELVELGRKYRNWKSGKKKWWNKEVEKKYLEVREVEKKWEKGNRRDGKEKVVRKRKKWREKVKEVKGEYWCKFLENLEVNESYRWIKTDKDFIVDLPAVKEIDERWYGEDKDKGREIVRGLGKREELLQEEKGGLWDIGVDIGEEEVEEVIEKQKDRKALGENGLGGKVLKLLWSWEGGRRVLMGIYRRSLELGYVCKRWRRSVGIVMRKPNKPDYSLPSSYRVINLLDVIGKGLERVVVGRMERWVQRGTRDS